MKKLSNLFIILNREIAAYFNSAIAYIFLIIFAFLNGGLFMTQFFLAGRVDMRSFFYTLPFLLVVFLPAVSMRLWSEEKRGNTQELLLTFPLYPHELVLGKFFASFLFYLIALASTFPIPIMLMFLGRPDLGAIISGYIGAAFLGGFFLAIGILISGFFRDQIVSFVLSMMICFGLFILGADFVASSLDGWVAGAGTFLRHFVGTADHYIPFAKGVIDGRDALYFVIGIAAFLLLNGFWIEGRMRPKARSIFATATILCAGIFLLSNWLMGGVSLGRFDLSEGKMYTLSSASKKILLGLKSPVLVKFYVSSADKMPTGMKTLEQDVRDKLEEFRVVSEGRFQYKIFHMDAANVVEGNQKQETLEEQISKKGIEPFQVESIQSDELGVRLIYSGLTISYKEKPEEILPRIHPGNLHALEYDMISRLYRMTLSASPKVALVAPYEERSVDPNLMALLQQLGGGQVPQNYRDDPYEYLQMGLQSEGYPVTRMFLDKETPLASDTKTLVVIEPHQLNERQKYEINRFLCQGGSVFMAVQNYEFNYRPSTMGSISLVPESKNPEINDLLSAWGLGVDTDILADEQNEIINISGGRAALLGYSLPVKLPVQIRLSDAEMNLKVSITSRLSAFFYMWGSALKMDPEKIKAQGLKVETLLTSSKNSWTVPFQSGVIKPESLAPSAKSPKGPFPLAVMVEGQFADAFKDKKMPDWPSAEDLTATPADSKKSDEKAPQPLKPKPGRLVLIGASIPFQKQLMQGGGHLNFFMNAMDVLTLGDALIGVRTKGPVDRMLPKVSASTKMVWRFWVSLFVPILLGMLGFGRAYWRRRVKQRYLKTLTP